MRGNVYATLGGLIAIGAAVVVFGLSRWLTMEVIAAGRRLDWANRPEIENWADPYAGLDWLPIALGAAVVTLTLGVPAIIGLLRRSQGST